MLFGAAVATAIREKNAMIEKCIAVFKKAGLSMMHYVDKPQNIYTPESSYSHSVASKVRYKSSTPHKNSVLPYFRTSL